MGADVTIEIGGRFNRTLILNKNDESNNIKGVLFHVSLYDELMNSPVTSTLKSPVTSTLKKDLHCQGKLSDDSEISKLQFVKAGEEVNLGSHFHHGDASKAYVKLEKDGKYEIYEMKVKSI